MTDLNEKQAFEKIRGSLEEISFEHKNKRNVSESTSILSSSSEENLTDSESSFSHRIRRSTESSEFPTLNRSRSQKSKNQYTIDVVNEEVVEDETENSPRKSKIHHSYSSTYLANVYIKNKQMTPAIDPILEVKEETEKFEQKVLESPRIKFMTDFSEDNISSKLINQHFNKYDITDEIIAEDNNENVIENETKKAHFGINEDDIEPIKEVLEEDEHMCDLNNIYIFTDELESPHLKRMISKLPPETKINECDEEDQQL